MSWNTHIPKFRRFVIQNFPFIEEDFDALTDYALICKVVEYLNKVITSQNEVVSELESFETNIINSFNELKSYVDNYFDNLDVQEEINNKLEQMAEDGTLTDIIAAYIQLRGILAYDTVADLKNATNIVNGSFVETYGFYVKGDGGGAKYKIRNVTNDDVVDNIVIIEITADPNNQLIAELMVADRMNVLQFGADKTCANDSTANLTKAFQLLNVVEIPQGTYLTGNLSANNIEIIGQNSTLKRTSDSGNMLTLEGDVQIKNVIFDDNNKPLKVIYMDDNDGTLVLDNITIKNMARAHYIQSTELTNLKKLHVCNSSFIDLGNTAIFGGYIKEANVTNNYFKNIGDYGVGYTGNAVYFGHSTDITITDNTAYNITDSCYYCSRSISENVIISNNKIVHCEKDGIKNQIIGRRTVITGNIVKECYAQAIVVSEHQEDCVVSNNIIEGALISGGVESASKNGAIGVMLGRNVVVSDNIVKFTQLQNKAGIYVYAATESSTGFQNNKIIISNNIVNGTSGTGIVLSNTPFATIEGNIIENANLDAGSGVKSPVHITNSGCSFIGNSIMQPDIISVEVTKSGDNKIEFPIYLPNCFNVGNSVMIYTLNGITQEQQTTTISSVDYSNHELTLADDITITSTENVIYADIDVSNITYNNSLRVSGTSNVVSIGNHIRNLTAYNPNVETSSTLLPTVSNYYNMNIKEAA